MTEQQLAKEWIEKHTKESALVAAIKMVEYRVQPLQYWKNLVTEIEKHPA